MADTPAGTTTDHHQPADASASLRVLVVDDHALVRSGVRSELTAHAPDLDVIAEADDVEGALAAVHALRPDVVLLDVHLPGGNGGGGAEVVASCHDVPETRFLALSVSDASDDVVGVIRAGARGYVTKAISTEDLAQAVRRVAAGEAAFSPRLHLQGVRLRAVHLGQDRRDPRLRGPAQAPAVQPQRAHPLGRGPPHRVGPDGVTGSSRKRTEGYADGAPVR